MAAFRRGDGFRSGEDEVMDSGSGTHVLVLGESEPMTSPPERPADGGGAAARALPLPDPVLVDRQAGIRLRPWATTAGDAEALAGAWDDPAIAAVNQVPDDRSVAAAARWIAGDAARRAAGRSLDLVISAVDAAGTGEDARGEVGLRNLDPRRRRAEISWWVAPAHRGQGLATAATRLLVGWALAPHGLDLVQVWARIAASNPASAHIAGAAGLTDLGVAGGSHVWARSA
jgi:RimJ/RimL family protein N-acetyltransferase